MEKIKSGDIIVVPTKDLTEGFNDIKVVDNTYTIRLYCTDYPEGKRPIRFSINKINGDSVLNMPTIYNPYSTVKLSYNKTLDKMPESGEINIALTDTPVGVNSENLYNLVKGKMITLDVNDKYVIDLKKAGEYIPVEQRKWFSEHIEDLTNAANAGTNINYADVMRDIGILGDPVLYDTSVDEVTNYTQTPQMTNLVFNKETQGYTATEDFEFLLISPTYAQDMKTRYNIAMPTGTYLYNEKLYSYEIVDNPEKVDKEYLANMLKYYFQLIIPTQTGENKEDKMLQSTFSQSEKINIAEMDAAFLTDDTLNINIDTYVDNIKKNSGGVFDEEAEHLREVLKKYNFFEMFADTVAGTDIDNSDEYINEFVQGIVDAGYNHNDFALMHLASAGALLGTDGLGDEIKADYEKLVKELGIEDKVEYTEGGIPKITLKAGETIHFTDYCTDPSEDPAILIYEKYYDDTEKVVNRTFRLAMDKDGTTNFYKAGGKDDSEPVEEIQGNNEEPTESTEPTVTEEPNEEPTEATVEEPTVTEEPIANEEPTVTDIPTMTEEVPPVEIPTEEYVEANVENPTVATSVPDTGDKSNIFLPLSILSLIGVLAGIGGIKYRKKED